MNEVIGSTISAENVDLSAKENINIKGSNLIATDQVGITAGGNINIESAERTGKEIHETVTKKSGLMSGGGLGFTIGKREQKDRYENQSLEQIGTVAGSITGDVKLNAGKDVNITASEILAGKDIDINGQNVTIKEGENKYKQTETHEYKQTGLTVSLGGGAIEAAEKVIQPIKRANQVKDERLEALYAYKAGKELEENKEKLEQAGKGNLGLKLNVSLGTSKSETKTESQTTIGQASTINAGGNINITANKGDITVKGSTVDGENIKLKAEENINILASENKNKTNEDTKSSGASIGVSIDLTTGGLGINAGFNKAEGEIKENGTTYNQTEITAGNKLTIESGKDTNIIGSTAAANKVEANIGGNLNIESLQDKQTYDEKNSSSGININTDIIGGKLSKPEINASTNKGKIESDYESVTNQAGIYAGQEGFDIHVEGNTDLKGAVIASEAEANKNKLSTETLTYSDIQNKAEYEASSAGINVNTDKDADYNQKGVTPNIGVKVEGDAESTTKAAIAEGTIEVRSEENKDLSELSRDTQNALNKLEQIFDKEEVQEKQELASLFGELAFEEIHKLSVKNGWKEGSKEKIALHALIGGIMAELGGGNALSGAAAAGVNEAIQKQLNNIDDPGLHQIASAIIGGVVGKLVAGDANTGASVAASATKNNNMLDPGKIKQLLYALKNAGSEEEKQKIMAQYIQYSVPSGANNMALSIEEEKQIAEYLLNNYGVQWQSGNIEISLQQAIDKISGSPGTNVEVNQKYYPESQGDNGQSANAAGNQSGTATIKTADEKVDELFQNEGWVDEEGRFRDNEGNVRQDLPSFGDYLLNQGGIIDSYYEDGTAAIKYNGNLYPAY